MQDVVVMEIHQHGNRLADDERDPHSGVAIVPVEEATHKPRQRNLRQEEPAGCECACVCDTGEGEEREHLT